MAQDNSDIVVARYAALEEKLQAWLTLLSRSPETLELMKKPEFNPAKLAANLLFQITHDGDARIRTMQLQR